MNCPPCDREYDMAFIDTLMIDYLDQFMHQIKGYNYPCKSRPLDRPTITNVQRGALDQVLHNLMAMTNELRKVLGGSYDAKFEMITTPLFLELTNMTRDPENFYKKFETVADNLFSQEINWIHIVTFLVFYGELAYRAIRWAESGEDDDKCYQMASNLLKCVSRYFYEKLMQWIDTQPGDWLSLVLFVRNRNDTDTKSHYYFRRVTQYVGTAALAVAIGGLFLMSIKATVQ